jgi:hypothetical protein
VNLPCRHPLVTRDENLDDLDDLDDLKELEHSDAPCAVPR